jgi:hypothetical protein
MEKVQQTLPNGNVIQYKVVNGTMYHEETPDIVVRILENARMSTARLRFAFGDTKTGKDWCEVYHICGRVGRSTGEIKIPLLIPRSNSYGGPALMDHCIVRIERKYRNDRKYTEVYKHEKYHI